MMVHKVGTVGFGVVWEESQKDYVIKHLAITAQHKDIGMYMTDERSTYINHMIQSELFFITNAEAIAVRDILNMR